MTKLAIIPFAVILLLYLLKEPGNYENYENILVYKKPRVTILSISQVKDFISSDSDDFITSLSVYDLRARKVTTSIEYINNIVASLNYSINNEIINRVIDICSKCDNILKNFDIELANLNWNIAFFNGKVYEGGFPHTRSDIIFLPLEYFINADESNLIKTFIHEKIHILQRTNPNSNLIKKFLYDNGFIRYKPINEMRLTHPKIRSNPDLDDWIYADDKIFYLCEYNSDFPSNIMDVIQNNKIEHPYEIMAYTISEQLLY